jgi:hypothetical protein
MGLVELRERLQSVLAHKDLWKEPDVMSQPLEIEPDVRTATISLMHALLKVKPATL